VLVLELLQRALAQALASERPSSHPPLHSLYLRCCPSLLLWVFVVLMDCEPKTKTKTTKQRTGEHAAPAHSPSQLCG
jgi:hypothetical protein